MYSHCVNKKAGKIVMMPFGRNHDLKRFEGGKDAELLLLKNVRLHEFQHFINNVAKEVKDPSVIIGYILSL
jgi:hypothetical protein